MPAFGFYPKRGCAVDPLKVAVIGVGHLGRYHAKTYANLANVQLVGLLDSDRARSKDRARELGVPAIADLNELLKNVDAVSVAVPTSDHHRIVKRCLQRGVHVLVEKPIATSLQEADDLIASAQHEGVMLQVGHIERFNPVFQTLAKMGLKPMFIESHRLAPFTSRGADVAVILDLMIHDIDLALTLVPGKISGVEAAGVQVLSEREDIANARVTFSNGTVANLTASRISAKAMRKMRLFQRDTYISADFLDRTVEIYRLRNQAQEEGREEQPLGSFAQKALFSKGRSAVCERPRLELKDALDSELNAFMNSIRKGDQPIVSGQDGRDALALALRIMEKIQEHARLVKEHGHS